MPQERLQVLTRELVSSICEAAVRLEKDGRGPLAVRLLRQLLKEDLSHLHAAERARLSAALGRMVWKQGGASEAQELAERAASLAEASTDPVALSEAVFALGEVDYQEKAFHGQGDYATPMAHHRRALELRREIGDRRGESVSLSRIGVIHERLGEHDEAETCYVQALKIADEIGFPEGTFRPLVHLGLGKDRAGDLAGALADHRRSLEAGRRAHDVHSMTFALCNVAETAYRLNGELEPALDLLDEALRLAEGMDFRLALCRVPLMTGEVYAEADKPREARRAYEKALGVAETEGFPRFVTYLRERLDALEVADA